MTSQPKLSEVINATKLLTVRQGVKRKYVPAYDVVTDNGVWVWAGDGWAFEGWEDPPPVDWK